MQTSTFHYYPFFSGLDKQAESIWEKDMNKENEKKCSGSINGAEVVNISFFPFSLFTSKEKSLSENSLLVKK